MTFPHLFSVLLRQPKQFGYLIGQSGDFPSWEYMPVLVGNDQVGTRSHLIGYHHRERERKRLVHDQAPGLPVGWQDQDIRKRLKTLKLSRFWKPME
jgi:hypothetical protein